ncbi:MULTISPECIES: hypothetical protein [unclassified Nitrospina]|uniref:hypothetical protein n=1 Tax=unclassified Nitrospina TaxID=2638683 RepID=UPI003F9D2F83
MRIGFLDQNKWIQLAQAATQPRKYPDHYSLLKTIHNEVNSGRLMLPLTWPNIYETYKINDPERRYPLAYVQAGLSKGLVFRGRYKRLKEEITIFSRVAYGLPPLKIEEKWFLSSNFFEAFLEADDERSGFSNFPNVLTEILNHPKYFLFDYLVNTPHNERAIAVKRFSNGSDQLRREIEDRRSSHKNEPLPLRRRFYGALLMVNDMKFIFQTVKQAGVPWTTFGDMGDSTARKLIDDVPTYCVERELILKLEAQRRPINENDFRDLESFCATLPYADIVIAEKQFVNLALQAGLDKRYNTFVATDIMKLENVFN